MQKGNQWALSIIISSLAMNAYAVGEGPYLGLLVGSAQNSGKTIQARVEGAQATAPATANKHSTALRLTLGNKFNKYAGLEFGINVFSDIKYSSNATLCNNSPTLRLRIFELAGKVSYPITEALDIDGRLGFAAANISSSRSLNPDFSEPCGKAASERSYRPTIGIGMSYNLNQNWVANISWDKYLLNNSKISSLDVFGIGIAYHWADVFCGQFLC